jgi:hypothetical protein
MSGPPDMGIRIRDHSVRPQPTVVVKTASKLEFGHSGGVTERVDDAIAECGLEFCWLG